MEAKFFNQKRFKSKKELKCPWNIHKVKKFLQKEFDSRRPYAYRLFCIKLIFLRCLIPFLCSIILLLGHIFRILASLSGVVCKVWSFLTIRFALIRIRLKVTQIVNYGFKNILQVYII